MARYALRNASEAHTSTHTVETSFADAYARSVRYMLALMVLGFSLVGILALVLLLASLNNLF